jgi:hypothetical protein
LAEHRENNRREPFDYPQGLSWPNRGLMAATKPFYEFLESTPAIIASGDFTAFPGPSPKNSFTPLGHAFIRCISPVDGSAALFAAPKGKRFETAGRYR